MTASGLSIDALALTHPGMVRSSNQDSFLVAKELGLFAVADGMGGHAGGEIASSTAVQVLEEYIRRHGAGADLGQILQEAVLAANERVFELALEDPNFKGMGTTLSALWIQDKTGIVAQVGDSRLYLIRCGLIYQITLDHSLIAQQLQAGLLSSQEAKEHHLKNVITRSVGYKSYEHVDIFRLGLNKGDILILCSDGLHSKVEDTEIASLAANSNQAETTHDLIALANQRGGEDNISVVVVSVKSD